MRSMGSRFKYTSFGNGKDCKLMLYLGGIRETEWVLERGLRKRTGDGNSMYIWTDSSLLRHDQDKLCPQSHRLFITSYVKVHDLMLSNGGGWAEDRFTFSYFCNINWQV